MAHFCPLKAKCCINCPAYASFYVIGSACTSNFNISLHVPPDVCLMYLIFKNYYTIHCCVSRFLQSYDLLTDDLSYKKNATQSHTSFAGWIFYYARYAIDRNAGSCMRAEDIGHNSLTKTVWWKVDLGRMYSIYSVDILFKNYTGYSMYFCIDSPSK